MGPCSISSGCDSGVSLEPEADDGGRTRDTWLGKPVLYQLSYVRAAITIASEQGKRLPHSHLPYTGS